MEVACATLAPSLQNPEKLSPVAGPVGAEDNRVLANRVLRGAVVLGLWATTDPTLMVYGRVRVVVHSPAASTGHTVCTAHAFVGGTLHRPSPRKALGPRPREIETRMPALSLVGLCQRCLRSMSLVGLSAMCLVQTTLCGLPEYRRNCLA
jgi:hypothetical protein